MPGAYTALSPVARRLGPVWGGQDHPRLVLLGAFVGSFGVSLCMLLIWRFVLAPAIPLYRHRSVSDKVFVSNSFVSLWPALTAPVLAWKAMQQLPWDDPSMLMVALYLRRLSADCLLVSRFAIKWLMIGWIRQWLTPCAKYCGGAACATMVCAV